ncbi:MAG: NAD(P)-dependent oxidoreductase [Actinomycetota bacterium]
MDIGFVGLGNIGGPCARHLVEAGHTVTVADLDGGARAALVAAGATEADASELGASCEVVFLSLPSPEASAAVVDQLLANARAGLVIVDLSTNSSGATAALDERCRAAGAHYLDCPVSGGNQGAEAGDLVLMPSGDEAAFDRALPAMLAFGKDDMAYLGPSGTGTMVKLINNLVFLVGTQVFEEAYLLAAKAGLDLPRFLEVLKGSSAGLYMALAPLIANRQWEESSYDLALAEKDLRLALESGREIESPLPLTDAAHGVLAKAVGLGLGEKFFIGAFEALEHEAGFTAPRPGER